MNANSFSDRLKPFDNFLLFFSDESCWFREKNKALLERCAERRAEEGEHALGSLALVAATAS